MRISTPQGARPNLAGGASFPDAISEVGAEGWSTERAGRAGGQVKAAVHVRERVDALIKKGEELLRTEKRSPYGSDGVDSQLDAEWRSQSRVCLDQVFGPTHAYAESFASETSSAGYSFAVRGGLGVLQAAREDLEHGYLDTVQTMATAEVFANFIDQAEHLLQTDHHIPAASLAGAVLENGLRSLAERNDITVKARDDLSALNSKLGEKGVYNRIRQSEVTFWARVRNAADHGRFEEVTKDNVADLIRGVRAFSAEYL